MKRTSQSDAADLGQQILLWALLALFGIALMAWLALCIGQFFTSDTMPSWYPGTIARQLKEGTISIGPASIGIFIAEVIVVGGLAGIVLARRAQKGGRLTIDKSAREITKVHRDSKLAPSAQQKKAQRLYYHADPKYPATLGLLIARTLGSSKQDIRMSWEDTLVMFAGQRMGKTTSIVCSSIVGAPGPVIATSNKGDIIDLTRHSRALRGRVWIFDLQNISGKATQRWWFDPLRTVHDLQSAKQLAEYFIGACQDDGARKDAYFDGEASEILAYYILAASLGGGDLRHTLTWLGNPDDDIPRLLLQKGGFDYAAMRVQQTMGLNYRQRDGIFAMARRFLGILADEVFAASVTPPQRVNIAPSRKEGQAVRVIPSKKSRDFALEEFNPRDFIYSTDTLYVLSTDTDGAPAALTTALVGLITDTAIHEAEHSSTGRLDTPLVAVLDEAANVVKLSKLPKMYSHWGSRGVIPLTFLQSPAQAERVWGADGVKTLCSSSNFLVYGGGISDSAYLNDLSSLIGDHEVKKNSRNKSDNGRDSVTVRWEKEKIVPVEDLASLPITRVIVFSSGAEPVLAEKVFYDPQDKSFEPPLPSFPSFNEEMETVPPPRNSHGPAMIER